MLGMKSDSVIISKQKNANRLKASLSIFGILTALASLVAILVVPGGAVFADGVSGGSTPSYNLPSDQAVRVGNVMNEEFFTDINEDFMDACRKMGLTDCESRYEAYDAARLQYEIYMVAHDLGENVKPVPEPSRDTFLQPYTRFAIVGNPTDPLNRTGFNMTGVFTTLEQNIIDPVSGDTYTRSDPIVTLSGEGLIPGTVYYPLATRNIWDTDTPNTGWDTTNGEAMTLQPVSSGPGYVTVGPDGRVSISVYLSPAWQGMHYVRLVTPSSHSGGGGLCLAPLAIY